MDFLKFDSKAEAKRYGELRLESAHGAICNLRCQVRLPLAVNGTKIGTYVVDFAYYRDGMPVYEDVKGGADTALSAWKRKHTEAQYGVPVNIITR
jgi:hypothetical protein